MSDALLGMGAGAITVGAWLIAPAFGLLVGGAFLLIVGWLIGLPKKRSG
jgi:hypothetical protein